jgi:cytochrome c-type biogenesis protein CcmH
MPARDELVREIAAVEATGRLPPPAAPAPEGAEMQAAVRGMVEGLAARLAENPDDPQGWVRLVRAYAVLGETDKLNSALATARSRYKDDAEIMASLTQAAEAPR